MTAARLDAHPPLCEQRWGGRVLARLRDGRVARGAGVLLFGAALPGTIEWLAGSADRVGWFPVAAGGGAVLLVIGVTQWQAMRFRHRAAITITAHDPGGSPDGADLAEAAVHYCRQTSELTLTVEADLTGDTADDWPIALQMLACTKRAIRYANRFKRDSARVNVVPTVRLHFGFWLGAELGRSPSKPIGLLQPKGGHGDDPYFLATVVARPGVHRWRGRWLIRSPFEVTPVDLTGRDQPHVALVVRTQRRGAAADERLKDELRNIGVDRVVWFQLRASELPNSTRGFTRAISQVMRDWHAQVPRDSAGAYVIYLDTTVTVAMALGARLAGPHPGLWEAYTQDRRTGGILQFPPARGGA